MAYPIQYIPKTNEERLYDVTWVGVDPSGKRITCHSQVAALGEEHARDKVGDMLARMSKVGAWYVDWSVTSATAI